MERREEFEHKSCKEGWNCFRERLRPKPRPSSVPNSMYREDRETVTCSKKSCHPSGCQNIVPQTPLKGPRGKESILHEAASAGSTHPKRGGGSPPLPTSGRRSKQSPGYHSEGCPGKSRLSSRAQPWQGGARKMHPADPRPVARPQEPAEKTRGPVPEASPLWSTTSRPVR